MFHIERARRGLLTLKVVLSVEELRKELNFFWTSNSFRLMMSGLVSCFLVLGIIDNNTKKEMNTINAMLELVNIINYFVNIIITK